MSQRRDGYGGGRDGYRDGPGGGYGGGKPRYDDEDDRRPQPPRVKTDFRRTTPEPPINRGYDRNRSPARRGPPPGSPPGYGARRPPSHSPPTGHMRLQSPKRAPPDRGYEYDRGERGERGGPPPISSSRGGPPPSRGPPGMDREGPPPRTPMEDYHQRSPRDREEPPRGGFRNDRDSALRRQEFEPRSGGGGGPGGAPDRSFGSQRGGDRPPRGMHDDEAEPFGGAGPRRFDTDRGGGGGGYPSGGGGGGGYRGERNGYDRGGAFDGPARGGGARQGGAPDSSFRASSDTRAVDSSYSRGGPERNNESFGNGGFGAKSGGGGGYGGGGGGGNGGRNERHGGGGRNESYGGGGGGRFNERDDYGGGGGRFNERDDYGGGGGGGRGGFRGGGRGGGRDFDGGSRGGGGFNRGGGRDGGFDRGAGRDGGGYDRGAGREGGRDGFGPRGGGGGGRFASGGGGNRFNEERGGFEQRGSGSFNDGGGFGNGGFSSRGTGGGNFESTFSSGFGQQGVRDYNETDGYGNRKFAPQGWVATGESVDVLFQRDAENAQNMDLEQDSEMKIQGDDTNSIHPIESWEDSGLDRTLVDILVHRCKYSTVRPIQRLCIPAIRAGRDVLAKSETGSGKSAAFLLPIISDIVQNGGSKGTGKPVALLLAPTKELVVQLYEQACKFATGTKVNVRMSIGQSARYKSIQEIAEGVDIIVMTIGRLKDFFEAGIIRLDSLRYFVIDEADRMLEDKGGKRELDAIFRDPRWPKPKDRQTLMFSATVPLDLQSYVKEQMKQDYVMVLPKQQGSVNARIKQNFVKASGIADKQDTLVQMLQDEKKRCDETGEPFRKTLIFCNQKKFTNILAGFLSLKEIEAQTINADKGQDLRKQAIDDFRSGKLKILVATDVCERGLDIQQLEHVINFDMPTESDRYVHRIGRTGRVHRGTATSFIDSNDRGCMNIVPDIIKMAREAQQEVPEWMEELARGGGGMGMGRGGGFSTGGFDKSEGFNDFGSGGFGSGGFESNGFSGFGPGAGIPDEEKKDEEKRKGGLEEGAFAPLSSALPSSGSLHKSDGDGGSSRDGTPAARRTSASPPPPRSSAPEIKGAEAVDDDDW